MRQGCLSYRPVAALTRAAPTLASRQYFARAAARYRALIYPLFLRSISPLERPQPSPPRSRSTLLRVQPRDAHAPRAHQIDRVLFAQRSTCAGVKPGVAEHAVLAEEVVEVAMRHHRRQHLVQAACASRGCARASRRPRLPTSGAARGRRARARRSGRRGSAGSSSCGARLPSAGRARCSACAALGHTTLSAPQRSPYRLMLLQNELAMKKLRPASASARGA